MILGLLCLSFSELNSNKSLGPVAAIGIACTLLVMMTFLPVLLRVGRSLGLLAARARASTTPPTWPPTASGAASPASIGRRVTGAPGSARRWCCCSACSGSAR